jgi:enoyl-CoA hydratase/carnithine racemase
VPITQWNGRTQRPLGAIEPQSPDDPHDRPIARHRLHPAHFDRTVVNATMYSPDEAVVAGFLDRVVPGDELKAASQAAAHELLELDAAAHAATKRRARAGALNALRLAIESELTREDFDPA